MLDMLMPKMNVKVISVTTSDKYGNLPIEKNFDQTGDAQPLPNYGRALLYDSKKEGADISYTS